MPNEICRVIVQEKSKDRLYRWFHTDKPIAANTDPIDLGTLHGLEVKDGKTLSNDLKIVADELFAINGISKVSISKYLLTVNLASEMFDWDKDDIELKVFKVIQDTVDMPVRVIKRKDSDGNVVNTDTKFGIDGSPGGTILGIPQDGIPPDPQEPETKDGGDPWPMARY